MPTTQTKEQSAQISEKWGGESGWRSGWYQRLYENNMTGSTTLATQRTTEYVYNVGKERVYKKSIKARTGGPEWIETFYVSDTYEVEKDSAHPGGELQRTSIYLGSLLVAVVEEDGNGTTEINYHHQDHLGGSSVVTNSQRQIVKSQDYYPFGSSRVSTGNYDADSHGFTDQERDEETNLHYYRARYYNSDIGRFTGQDPLQMRPGELRLPDPQQLNYYSYVANNPLKYVDPSGEAAVAAPLLLISNPLGWGALVVVGVVAVGIGIGYAVSTYDTGDTTVDDVLVDTSMEARTKGKEGIGETDFLGKDIDWVRGELEKLKGDKSKEGKARRKKLERQEKKLGERNKQKRGNSKGVVASSGQGNNSDGTPANSSTQNSSSSNSNSASASGYEDAGRNAQMTKEDLRQKILQSRN